MTKIPKIIHFVWMGGKKKPLVLRHCIKNWHKMLPDYEFKEWNEKNFPIDDFEFTKNAYANKQWAFVSDFVRAWALYNYGGIYFDTDVVVIKKIDPLLNNRAFVGFESKKYPFTAVFGTEKKHPLVKSILAYYDNLTIGYSFKDNNTISVSDMLVEDYKCKRNNKEQVLNEDIHVYPDGYLCNPSTNSYTVHLFYGGWGKSGRNLANIKREFLRGYLLTSPSRIKLYEKIKKR